MVDFRSLPFVVFRDRHARQARAGHSRAHTIPTPDSLLANVVLFFRMDLRRNSASCSLRLGSTDAAMLGAAVVASAVAVYVEFFWTANVG